MFLEVVMVLEDAREVHESLQSLRTIVQAYGGDQIWNAEFGLDGIVIDAFEVDDVGRSHGSICGKLSTCGDIFYCHCV